MLEDPFQQNSNGVSPSVAATLRATDIPIFLREVAWESQPIHEWRSRVRGAERRPAQEVLLDAARNAEKVATANHVFLLYWSAENILPLRGSNLSRLVQLALIVLPHPLPLEILPVLLRYERQKKYLMQNSTINEIKNVILSALDTAESQIIEGQNNAVKVQIASLRRSAVALQ